MTRLFRSLIFVPGNNSRFLEKAKSLEADIVCFDLEDSVPESEKQKARSLIQNILSQRSQFSSSVFVRTNSPISGKIPADLKEIVRRGLDGIVIPKVNNVKELSKIEKLVGQLEKKHKTRKLELVPSIESTQGVVNCFDISSHSKRITAIVFGVFDLLNDMGIEYTKQPEGAKYSREKIAVDSRAAGIPAIDAIWQDLKDKKGFEQDCMIGKRLGYAGKSIIHPDQIPIVHKVFFPNQTEIEWAEKVCKNYLQSSKKGRGATVVDGKMIDEVHFKQAKALLELVQNKA